MRERNSGSGSSKKPQGSSRLRGEAGRRQMQEELARQKQRAEERKNQSFAPFRYYTPVGATQQIIILDDEPDFFMYEHALKDSQGRWGRLHTGCVRTFDNCPVCEATGRESYYGLYLSVIDLTPYDGQNGRIDFTRKLLVVKPAQQKKFLRFFEKHGSLRGALFEMTRDGDKDPGIGNDIEFLEFVEEDELADYVRTWKDGDGKKHTEDCSQPFDYDELFEEPDVEKLREIAGTQPTPGSRDSDRKTLNDRSSSRSSRSSSRKQDKDDWEDENESRSYSSKRGRKDEEEEGEDDAPKSRRAARSATRGKKVEEEAPRSRRTSRKAKDEDEDEDEEADDKPWKDEEEDEAPTPPRRRGKRVEKEEEPDEDEEDEDEDEDEDEAEPPRRRAARTPARGKKEEEPEDTRPSRRVQPRRGR